MPFPLLSRLSRLSRLSHLPRLPHAAPPIHAIPSGPRRLVSMRSPSSSTASQMAGVAATLGLLPGSSASALLTLWSHVSKLSGTGHPLLDLLKQRIPSAALQPPPDAPAASVDNHGSTSPFSQELLLKHKSDLLLRGLESSPGPGNVPLHVRGLLTLLYSKAAAETLGVSDGATVSDDHFASNFEFSSVLGPALAPLAEGVASSAAGSSEEPTPSVVFTRAETLATICEMIHLASLIHDNVLNTAGNQGADVASKLTLGNKVAVLSGDYLLAQACLSLASLRSPQVVELMSQSISDLVEGRFMVLSPPPALSERYSLAYCQSALQKKAASLLLHSCQSAVLLLPAGQSSLDGRSVRQETLALSARSFGNFVGLAMEISEDMRAFSQPESNLLWAPTVASSSARFLRKKACIPVAFALQSPNCSPVQRKELAAAVDEQADLSPETAAKLLEIVHATRALDHTREWFRDKVSLAEMQLRPLAPSPWKDKLGALLLQLSEPGLGLGLGR